MNDERKIAGAASPDSLRIHRSSFVGGGAAMRKGRVQAVAPLASVAFVLAGVVTLGRLAADDLRRYEHYSLTFSEVRCAPPPGLRRDEFLREVQYEAELSDRLDRFDTSFAPRLRAAFLRHPWVLGV